MAMGQETSSSKEPLGSNNVDDKELEKDSEKFERRSRAHSTPAESGSMISHDSSQQPLLMQGLAMAPNCKTLTLMQIFLLNAVVCGVEICACAGFTYIPPMLLKAGYAEENMSIILGLGPLLGFFLVPLIGRASDRCRSSYGRRRPFILVISVILILSLIDIPYIDVILLHTLGPGSTSKGLTLFLMTLGVVLLDFTSQACLTPCEALLSDASKETDQHQRVFIVYSLMVSLGGLIGYLITAIDWNSTFLGTYFGNQERTVFTLLVILFSILLSATIMVAQEKPLIKQGEMKPGDGVAALKIGNGSFELGIKKEEKSSFLSLQVGQLAKVPSLVRTIQSSPQRTRTSFKSLPKVLIKSILSMRFVSAICNILCLLWVHVHENFPEPVKRLYEVPFVLRHLAVANFCSWTAVMGFNLFFTDFVGNAVYKGNPNAPEDSYLRNRFDEGVRMGSWGLLLHCITSAIYALFVERLVDRFGCKLTYMFGMISFSAAMLGMVCVREIAFVNIMAALTGFGYATLTTIPFILVTKYHSEREIFFFDVIPNIGTSNNPSTPSHGIGTDMATLDSAYFLSQVVLSCIMGYIVHITGSVLSYMAAAGIMGILSCFFIHKIFVNKQDVLRYRQAHASIAL